MAGKGLIPAKTRRETCGDVGGALEEALFQARQETAMAIEIWARHAARRKEMSLGDFADAIGDGVPTGFFNAARRILETKRTATTCKAVANTGEQCSLPAGHEGNLHEIEGSEYVFVTPAARGDVGDGGRR